MTDPARGPTTEELRARVLAHEERLKCGAGPGSDTTGAAARNSRPTPLCGCRSKCGDDGATEGPGTCKGLPRMPEPPLVEVVLVPREGRTFYDPARPPPDSEGAERRP